MISASITESPCHPKFNFQFENSKVVVASETISNLSSWRIFEPMLTIIVHLGGKMNQLDSRINHSHRNLLPACRGDVWMIPPQATYEAEAQGECITYAEIQLDFGDFQLDPTLSKNIPPTQASRIDFIYLCVQHFTRIPADWSPELRAITAQSLLSTLAHSLHIESSNIPSQHLTASFSPTGKRNTEEFIVANFKEKITLKQLADLNDLTIHQFLTQFRTTFGTTPVQYIIRQRIQKAKWLLENSTLPIGEIALEAGFCNQSHLTSNFQKHMQITPLSFRKASQQASG